MYSAKLKFIAFAYFLFASVLVNAAPIVWTLNPATLTDGSSVSGTFTYDPDTATVSAVNITQTNGASTNIFDKLGVTSFGYLRASKNISGPTPGIYIRIDTLSSAGGTFNNISVGVGTCNSFVSNKCTNVDSTPQTPYQTTSVATVSGVAPYSLPTVSAVSPISGTTAGGTSITITGTNFTGATVVNVGGAACTNYVVLNATTITCTTPVGSAGTANVEVTTPGGTNAANTLFTYVAAPTVSSVLPTSGSTSGGTSITITGTNFTGATGVTIGGAACTNVVVVDATTISCTTPAGTAGAVSVEVTTPGGTNAANTLFTYIVPTPAAIPTLGEWGMIFMASLMAMFGIRRMRRSK